MGFCWLFFCCCLCPFLSYIFSSFSYLLSFPLQKERVGPRTPIELDETPHTPLVSERGPRTPPGDTPPINMDVKQSPESRERLTTKRARSRSPRPHTPVESPPTYKRPKSSDDDDDIFRNTPISSPVNTVNVTRTIFDLNTPPKSPSPHPRTPPFSPPTSNATPSSHLNNSFNTPSKKKEEQQKEMFRHQVGNGRLCVIIICLN